MGELGWPKCVGVFGWFKSLGMLGWLGSLTRNFKESIFIRVNNPTLTKILGNLICPKYGIGSYLIPLALP